MKENRDITLVNIKQYLLQLIATKLDLDIATINYDAAFFSLGMTSLISEEVLLELSDCFGDLSSTTLFEYPNINKLGVFLFNREHSAETITYILNQIGSQSDSSSGQMHDSDDESDNTGGASNNQKGEQAITTAGMDGCNENGYQIAVIGVSGVFPGAENQYEFWNNLIDNKDSIEEIPKERWDADQYFSEDQKQKHTSYAKWGGFIKDIDRFDPLFFNISHKEAELMDPQQKLFLQCCWEAMEDAGYANTKMRKTSNIGVYAGVTWNDFSFYVNEKGFLSNQDKGPGALYWGIPNRVSFFLDITGPSVALDAACSSSLVSVHEACRAILAGDCEMAIAGGVNLNLHPAKYIYLSQSKFLSTDGKCRSFAEGANGYTPGEGVAAVILKPLAQARADGDQIYGIIRSSAVNHGGKSTGYTVPSPDAHKKLIISAIDRAHVDPEDIRYIECHGTGTALGDPIEVKGLSLAFEHFTEKKDFCYIGSVKSNIGHLEAAAGVSGLIKILLSMKHKYLPASIHADHTNEKINFADTPFRVVKENIAWPEEGDHSLLAGISSFGAGGSNAHLIVESNILSANDNIQYDHDVTGEVITLSAQSELQLQEYARKMYQFFSGEYPKNVLDDSYTLSNIAHTLQRGREHFEYRLAILASDVSDLCNKLQHYSEGDVGDDDIVCSASITPKDMHILEKIDPSSLHSKNHEDQRLLAALWVAKKIDSCGSEKKEHVRTVSLPTYPFLKEKSWVSEGDVLYEKTSFQSSHSSALHPLIDSNSSTIHSLKFQKRLFRTEYFLEHHFVADKSVIPGVCHLEIITIAGELSTEQDVGCIKEIWYSNPIVVEKEYEDIVLEFVPRQGELHFAIKNNNNQNMTYSQGKIVYGPAMSRPYAGSSLDISDVTSRFSYKMDISDVYALFTKIGIVQKYSFQVVRELHLSSTEAFGVVQLPEKMKKDFTRYKIHPALMDGAVQVAMMQLLHALGKDVLIVPFYFGNIEILGSFTEKLYIHVTLKDLSNMLYQIDIYNEDGEQVIRVNEFILKAFKEHAQSSTADMYYLPEFQKQALEKDNRDYGTIVIFDHNTRFRDAMLEQSGVPSSRLLLVKPGKSFEKIDEYSYVIDPCNLDHYLDLCTSLVEHGSNKIEVIHLWNYEDREQGIIDHEQLLDTFSTGIESVFNITKAMLLKKINASLLYLFYGNTTCIQPDNRAMSGFFKTVELESPAYRYKLVQVDHCDPVKLSRIALDELCSRDKNTEIMYVQEERYKKGYASMPQESDAHNPQFKEYGCYLITGGMGGLGYLFAEQLTKTYKAHCILLGRSELSEEKKAMLAKLESHGGKADYIQCDISDINQVSECETFLSEHNISLHGILHSAGIIEDAFILNKDYSSFSRVVLPKINGAIFLDLVFESAELDFFVLFSSISSELGNLGQADYAYSNAFLDNFSQYREQLRKDKKRFGKTLSINWPYWKEGGMLLSPQEEKLLSKNFGILPLEKEKGIQALEKGLALDYPQVIVMDGNTDKIEEVLGVRDVSGDKISPDEKPHAGQVEASGENLDEMVETYLKDFFSRELKIPKDRLKSNESFDHYGFDSIAMINFINLMEETFGSLPKTLFFEYTTLQEVKEYFKEHHADSFVRGKDSAGTASPKEDAPVYSSQDIPREVFTEKLYTDTHRVKDIAIVGVSGRYPKAESVEQYWQNFMSGVDCVSEIPKERWDYASYFDSNKRKKGKTYSKWGGFIDDVDKFDPLFFKVAPGTVKHMDPQQRIMLEVVWSTLEDAGYTKDTIVANNHKRNVGVFIGSMWNGYSLLAEQEFLNGSEVVNSYLNWEIANRISYHLDFNGPSIAIDTACSSSLLAIKMACDSIINGESSVAIAGGINLSLSPSKYIKLAQDNFISTHGKCKSFGEGGDGYVPGEGAGAVLLKPLEQAERDGDNIYAVIKGSAVNHGGKTKGFNVPNLNMQAEVILDAMKNAEVNPRTLSYVEAHGTGTMLGDPIEIRALTKAFSHYSQDLQYCSIGSSKSNIGHLEAAAGIAAITKVMLMMKHKQLVPSLHAEEINKNIAFEESPFYLQRELSEWKKPEIDNMEFPRRAAISSFGAGGTNVHVILEEYERHQAVKEEDESGQPKILLFSAQEEPRLREYLYKFKDYLYKQLYEPEVTEIHSLENIAYTLQVGREHHEARIAVIAHDKEEAYAALGKYLDADTVPENVIVPGDGTGSYTMNDLDVLLKKQDFAAIAKCWTLGFEVDWHDLCSHAGKTYLRVSLPTYSFAKERYWFASKSETLIEI